MMDEKRKILELLEKGLITTDEALELLAALEGEGHEPQRREDRGPEGGTGSTLRLDIDLLATDLTFALAEGSAVQVEMTGQARERVEVEHGEGYLRLYEKRETRWGFMTIMPSSGAVTVKIPRGFKVQGKVVGVASDIQGDLNGGKGLLFRTVSGDVDVKGDLPFVEARTVSGDIRLRHKPEGKLGGRLLFQTVSGDIRLILAPGSGGIQGQGSAVSGVVDVQISGVEKKKKGMSYLLERPGEPRLELVFKTVSGDVMIREEVFT